MVSSVCQVVGCIWEARYVKYIHMNKNEKIRFDCCESHSGLGYKYQIRKTKGWGENAPKYKG